MDSKNNFFAKIFKVINSFSISEQEKENKKKNILKKYDYIFDINQIIEDEDEFSLNVSFIEVDKKELDLLSDKEKRVNDWRKHYESNSEEDDDEEVSWTIIPEIDQPENFGFTKLMKACLSSNVEEIKKLISNGANPKIKANSGLTAFELAVLEEKYESVKCLTECGIIE